MPKSIIFSYPKTIEQTRRSKTVHQKMFEVGSKRTSSRYEQAQTQIQRPSNIGRLPNEIQDIIFNDSLGRGLGPFCSHRSTHDSALEALWKYNARDHEAPPSPSDIVPFENFARRRLRKLRLVCQFLKLHPNASIGILELTLLVPTYRLEAKKKDREYVRGTYAKMWQPRMLSRLYPRLPELTKLRVIGLWVPRAQGSTIAFAGRRKDEQAAPDPWPIPNSVKDLTIEHVIAHDHSEVPLPGPDNGVSCLVDILSNFEGYHNIEKFHLKAPYLDDRTLNKLDNAPNQVNFSKVKEFRLDLQHADPMDAHLYFEKLVPVLHNWKDLRILDVRHPSICIEHNGVLCVGWVGWLDQVRVVRISFQGFAAALEKTIPSNDIHFELLLDMDQVLKDTKEAVKAPTSGWLSLQQMMHEVALNLKALEKEIARETMLETEYKERVQAIEMSIKTVTEIGALWDRTREIGLHEEKRHVKIIGCKWPEESMGTSWFVNKQLEQRFRRDLLLFTDVEVYDELFENSDTEAVW